MRFGIIGNPRYPDLRDVLARLEKVAARHRVDLSTESALIDSWPHPPEELDVAAQPPIDLLMTFGGDGTLLRGARVLGSLAIPVMGVNLGRVGFLTTATPAMLDRAVQAFVRGEYVVEPRHTWGTTIVVPNGREQMGEFALNDVVVHKAGVARVIQAVVHVDDEEIGQYSADGIIVATPTGSTAYSLSAGGSIVVPTVDALVITAICPHTLAVRPIVVPGGATIRIEPVAPYTDEVLVSYDGQVGTNLGPGSHIVIARKSWQLRLVRLGKEGFFERVRDKLQWGDLSDRETRRRTDMPATS